MKQEISLNKLIWNKRLHGAQNRSLAFTGINPTYASTVFHNRNIWICILEFRHATNNSRGAIYGVWTVI